MFCFILSIELRSAITAFERALSFSQFHDSPKTLMELASAHYKMGAIQVSALCFLYLQKSLLLYIGLKDENKISSSGKTYLSPNILKNYGGVIVTIETIHFLKDVNVFFVLALLIYLQTF